MKAEAVYFVITPEGHASDSMAFDRDLATTRYIKQWLPPKICLSDYLASQLWSAFEAAGYQVRRVNLPPAVAGMGVCRT